MEGTPSSKFSSPVIQKNTPTKRLGLSRKRKSSRSDNDTVTKVQALGNESPNPAIKKQVKENSVKDKSSNIVIENEEESEQTLPDKVISEDEINSLRQKISEKEIELKSLKSKNNIESLENLIEVWKSGCKSAYLYLVELLKEKYPEKIDSKMILQKLGIFKTMSDIFETDSEISLSDSSQ